jgi:hypothetical protein
MSSSAQDLFSHFCLVVVTLMSIYIVLQCISFVSSLSLVCGTINVRIHEKSFLSSLSSRFPTETSEAHYRLAGLAGNFGNLLGFGITLDQRRQHDALCAGLRIFLDLRVLALQNNQLGTLSRQSELVLLRDASCLKFLRRSTTIPATKCTNLILFNWLIGFSNFY